MVLHCYGWSYFHYCLFSYSSLLELQYGGRIWKSQATRNRAREMGILVRAAEFRIDAELFLSEYPRWELGAHHWSVILHKMFLHMLSEGIRRQKDSITGDAEAVHQNLT